MDHGPNSVGSAIHVNVQQGEDEALSHFPYHAPFLPCLLLTFPISLSPPFHFSQ